MEIGFDIDVWFANVSYTLGAIDLFRVNLAQSAGPWPGPRLVDTDLPEGYVNQPYDIAIDYSGGDPPLTLSITYGSLPPGLALSGDHIVGTPTPAAAGTCAAASP